MAVVFVNYRVRAEPGYATLIHRELAARFGADQIFIASTSIRSGDDFITRTLGTLRGCAVVLAVIGHEWLSQLGNAETDWVWAELRDALARKIRVIPVLIEDAELPSEQELPPDIAVLARSQYVRLRHYSLRTDLAFLVDELLRSVPALRGATGTAEAGAARQLFRSTHSDCLIGVIPGTIRRVRDVDVWVNSENTDMRMARYTDFSISAIIRYWGAKHDGAGQVVNDLVADELQARVGHRPLAPGATVTTGAGELATNNNVRFVIHVAAVQGEPGAGYRQVRNVDWCVTNVLAEVERLATDEGVRSVLLPLLGAGEAGADVESTARVMVESVIDHLARSPDTLLHRIFLLGYSEREYAALTELLLDRLRPVASPA